MTDSGEKRTEGGGGMGREKNLRNDGGSLNCLLLRRAWKTKDLFSEDPCPGRHLKALSQVFSEI